MYARCQQLAVRQRQKVWSRPLNPDAKACTRPKRLKLGNGEIPLDDTVSGVRSSLLFKFQ